MNLIDEIIIALLLAGPNDLEEVRRYIRWIRIRRQVNDRFYYAAHWISQTMPKYHWVGECVDF